MRYFKKQSKNKKKEKIQNLMSGNGVYLYENNTDADLTLPKPSLEGFKSVGPRKRFKGDSYFMCLVKTPICLLKVIEELKIEEKEEKTYEKEAKTEEIKEKKASKLINKRGNKKKKKKKTKLKDKKMKEKLILDQPEVVTKSGKLEQVDVEESAESQEEKLLTEDPAGDIQIISD